jgi:transposase-like protein
MRGEMNVNHHEKSPLVSSYCKKISNLLTKFSETSQHKSSRKSVQVFYNCYLPTYGLTGMAKEIGASFQLSLRTSQKLRQKITNYGPVS